MFIYGQKKSLFLFSGEAGRVAVSHIFHHVDMYIKLVYNRRERHWQWVMYRAKRKMPWHYSHTWLHLLSSSGQLWLSPLKELNNKFMRTCKSFSIMFSRGDAITYLHIIAEYGRIMLPSTFMNEDVLGRDVSPSICQLSPLVDDLLRIERKGTLCDSGAVICHWVALMTEIILAHLIQGSNLFNFSNVLDSIYMDYFLLEKTS